MASKFNAAIVIVLGLAAVFGGVYLYYSGMQAGSDVDEVEATVISSSVSEVSSPGEPDSYTASIQYRYSYDGETYTTRSICPGAGSACVPTSDSQSDIEDFLEDYEEGSNVTAYVSQSDPSEAYLLDEDPSLIYFVVSAFGLLFLGLGVRDLMSDDE